MPSVSLSMTVQGSSNLSQSTITFSCSETFGKFAVLSKILGKPGEPKEIALERLEPSMVRDFLLGFVDNVLTANRFASSQR